MHVAENINLRKSLGTSLQYHLSQSKIRELLILKFY